MKIRLKRLNESGFDHVMILVMFVALFALIGTWLLLMSNAATQKVTLHLASTTGPCVAGTTIQHCSGSPAQTWDKLTGSNFQIKNGLGQCLDDWNGKVHTSPKDKNGYIHVSTCYGDANQKWNWAGSGELRNVASGGCLNAKGGTTSPGTVLIVYACNGQANEIWKEGPASNSGGGSGGGGGGGSSSCTGTMSSRFICQAKKYAGSPYIWGGGHDYGSFKHLCPSPSSSYGCGADCSGFVSVVVDDVTGGSYSWTAQYYALGGSSTAHWHKTSLNSVVPGDIIVGNQHVEFVLSGRGSNIVTFGQHSHDEPHGASPGGATGTAYHWY